MDGTIDNNIAVLIVNNQCEETSDPPFQKRLNVSNYPIDQTMTQEEVHEPNKQSAIWSKSATLMLLNIYKTKLSTLTNPKKKSKMWLSMAEELKSLKIEVTPDQVRWKINALTKRYRHCLESGHATGFKYYNEMHQILSSCNENQESYTLSSDISNDQLNINSLLRKKSFYKTGTLFKTLRSECRTKIELEKQMLGYLRRQEIQNQKRDERYERTIRLREEEIALKKQELEVKQTIALKKLQLKEKHNEEILKTEREKCDLLRKLLGQ